MFGYAVSQSSLEGSLLSQVLPSSREGGREGHGGECLCVFGAYLTIIDVIAVPSGGVGVIFVQLLVYMFDAYLLATEYECMFAIVTYIGSVG